MSFWNFTGGMGGQGQPKPQFQMPQGGNPFLGQSPQAFQGMQQTPGIPQIGQPGMAPIPQQAQGGPAQASPAAPMTGMGGGLRSPMGMGMPAIGGLSSYLRGGMNPNA